MANGNWFTGTPIRTSTYSPPRRCCANRPADIGRSGPVVGVAGEDGLGAIDLFEQHATRKKMRPRHRAERHDVIRLGANVLGEAVRAADQEDYLGNAGVAPLAETLGEFLAAELRPRAVERDHDRAFGNRLKQQVAFALNPFGGRRRGAFLL